MATRFTLNLQALVAAVALRQTCAAEANGLTCFGQGGRNASAYAVAGHVCTTLAPSSVDSDGDGVCDYDDDFPGDPCEQSVDAGDGKIGANLKRIRDMTISLAKKMKARACSPVFNAVEPATLSCTDETGSRLAGECSAGFIKDSSGDKDQCIDHTKCGAGKYTQTVGTSDAQPVCVDCDPGSFKPTISASSTATDTCTAHTACAAGYFTFIAGTTTSEPECEPCASGTVKAEASTSSTATDTCTPDGLSSASPISDCAELGAGAESQIYWTNYGNSDLASEETKCESEIDGGGWTLLASFVNDGDNPENTSWSGADYEDWKGSITFGSAALSTSKDFRGSGWSNLTASDMLIKDEFGWISFEGALGNKTIQEVLQGYTACSTTPLLEPGSTKIRSSCDTWADHGMLAFFAKDPNNNLCSFDDIHNDGTVIAISGAGCGTMGAGQVGTNYHSMDNGGMDWHASLQCSQTCACCDQCGEWFGHCVATSTVHNNNPDPGGHDDSTWGELYVR